MPWDDLGAHTPAQARKGVDAELILELFWEPSGVCGSLAPDGDKLPGNSEPGQEGQDSPDEMRTFGPIGASLPRA